MDGIVHTIAGKVSSPAGYSKKKDLLIHNNCKKNWYGVRRGLFSIMNKMMQL